jgi:hypothetical protein
MTYEQLENYLDDDLKWRKKEITDLLFLAKENNNIILLKSMILLLYAHWEGYIKKSSKVYLRFIVEKKVPLKKLSSNFKAAALKGNIKQCFESNDSLNLSNELTFIKKYLTLEDKKFKISIDPDDDFDKSIIDTQSNLNPDVLKNIYGILGVQYKEALETRKNYIDRNLLHVRNTIGHGSKYKDSNEGDLILEIEDVERLKNIVVLIIDNFRDELLDYAYKEYYLIENEDERLKYETQKGFELDKLLKELEEIS